MNNALVRVTLAMGMVFCSLLVWLGAMPGSERTSGIVLAADTLKIDNLPHDPRQFRAQVDQILARADSLIKKLKGNPAGQGTVLDLMQTRDNILREIAKIDSRPGDAKWTSQEMRESVEAMLKLLKEQYDKAAGTV